jgi:hypothetical protein
MLSLDHPFQNSEQGLDVFLERGTKLLNYVDLF